MSLAVLLSHVASSGTVANRSRAQGLHFVEAERVLKHLQALRDLLSTLSTWSPVSLDSFLSRAVSHKNGQVPCYTRADSESIQEKLLFSCDWRCVNVGEQVC